jgi:membrane-associated phospholipid phosphatase
VPQEKQIQKKAKGITLGLFAGILFFLLAAVLFWRITDEIVLEKGTGLDLGVYNFISRFRTPGTTRLMLFFTFFGSVAFLLPAYILLAAWFLFYKKDRLQAFVVVAIGISSKLLLTLLKNIFRRDRPLEPLTPNVPGYSYPSGHSFSAFIFFGLLTYLTCKMDLPAVWKWILSVLFILIAFLTATSRVYLHVHFASDAIASFCLSVIWLSISLWVVEKMKKTK